MDLNEAQKLELMKQNVSYLTKRELFAAMVMQSVLSNQKVVIEVEERFTLSRATTAVAKTAIEYADALIVELSKEKK